MAKVKVTHIELKMEIGTGWAKTFNMFALCEPHEVKFQKNFPDHMRVEVSDFGSVRISSRVYKLAKETSDLGKVDWTRSGCYYIPGNARSRHDAKRKAILQGSVIQSRY